MTCYVPLWFELAYLALVALVSAYLLLRQQKAYGGLPSFLLTASIWPLTGIILFVVVDFVAMSYATGMYARETGLCAPEAKIIWAGSYLLFWIPLFLVAAFWQRAKAKKPKVAQP